MKQPFIYSFASLTCVIVLVYLSGCASLKSSAYDPAGTWNFSVTGTPQGSVNGTMVISKNGNAYTGELRSPTVSTPLDNLHIEDRAMNAEFQYQGTDLQLKGAFEKDTFNGEVVAGYDSFNMTANRSN